ncbi:HD domain-containing protein [bacterium]|nr:HD domain-containing protein [bacterium]
MNRVEKIRLYMDDLLEKQKDNEIRRCGYVHLYGVSLYATLLAGKRGLNNDIAAVIGMMHDIKSFRTGNPKEHAKLGAIEAEVILTEMDDFSEEEIQIICHAISNHSNKLQIDCEYSELIKDADTLHHYFYNPVFGVPKKEEARLQMLLIDLGHPAYVINKE